MYENLTPEQREICLNKGTEAPFSGAYWSFKGKGIYRCVCCGRKLFDSAAKFDSKTGWPSFFEAAGRIRQVPDESHGIIRQEVQCDGCGAHLGHVFDDGPEPTGLRFCVNSAALKFEEDGQGCSKAT